MSDFAVCLQDLMTCHNITQRQLASDIGLSNATICRLVNGESRYPDVETLIKLADHFGVTTDYLLGRES